jgi:hypothetical protein
VVAFSKAVWEVELSKLGQNLKAVLADQKRHRIVPGLNMVRNREAWSSSQKSGVVIFMNVQISRDVVKHEDVEMGPWSGRKTAGILYSYSLLAGTRNEAEQLSQESTQTIKRVRSPQSQIVSQPIRCKMGRKAVNCRHIRVRSRSQSQESIRGKSTWTSSRDGTANKMPTACSLKCSG